MKKSLLITIFLSLVLMGSAQPVFDPLAGPPGGNILQIERTSTKVFALTSKGLYQSTNNGNDWTKNAAIELVAVDLSNQGLIGMTIDMANKIYVATKGSLYKSTDDGVTWTGITPTGDYNPEKRLQKSEATGSLFVHGYYFTGGYYGVQKSTDDGLTWFDVSPVAGQINDFVIKNDISFSHLYASPNGGGANMYKSIDDGASWSPADTGLPNSVSISYKYGITVNKFNGKIYCLPYSATGGFESSNDGASWTSVTTGSPITFGDGNSQYSIFASQTSARIFIRYNNNVYYNDTPLSTPASWTLLALNNTDPLGYLHANGSGLFAGLYNEYRSADGILRSTNNGVSWSYSDKGINEYEASSFVRADNGRLIVINRGGTIMSSNNEGATWTKEKQCDCSFESLIKRDNGSIVAIGDRTYRSTDNGGSWSEIGGPHLDYLSRLTTGDGGTTIFGVGGIGGVKIYKSTDGGVSFAELAISGFSGSPEIFGLAADDANNLYAYTNNYEVYNIPGPGNTTATQITNSGITNFTRGVYTVGSAVYMVGENSTGNTLLAKTVNQGSDWTSIIIDDAAEVRMISDDLIFARNYDNQFAYSNDAGLNWDIIIDPNISGIGFAEVEVDNNGIAYAALTQGPMYKSASTVVRPNMPMNLVEIGKSDNTVYLEWAYNSSGGATIDAFDIMRRPAGVGTYEKIGEANDDDRYYMDKSVAKNTAYDYQIIAQNDAGDNTSGLITVTTTDDCSQTIPDNMSWDGIVSPGAVPTTGISIRRVSDDYYQVSEFTAGTLDGIGSYSNTEVSAFFQEACGTPFIESTDGVFPNGNGAWNGTNTLTLNFQLDKSEYPDTEKSIELTLSNDAPVPDDPENITAYLISDTQVEIQWSAGAFQQKYIIERSLDGLSGFAQVGTVDYPILKFADSGPFTNGTTYFYRVKAENGDAVPDESNYSDVASVEFTKPIFVLSNTIVSSTQTSAPSMAWADFDNDGFEDLVAVQLDFLAADPSEVLLFKNNGGTDFQLMPGALPAGYNMVGPTVADYDNDGNLDIFIGATGVEGTGATSIRNFLLKNNGAFDFTDVDNSLLTDIEDDGGSIGGAWVDVNSNGFLDLFVPYSKTDFQKLFSGSSSGTFIDNSLAGELISDSFSKQASFWADYDNDGDQDVFILTGEDDELNRLYNNDGGIFTLVAGSGIDEMGSFFSASWGDYDNDQFLDLFITNQDGPNFLYKNNGNGTFSKQPAVDNTPTEDLANNAASTGSAWGDVDNDGDLDLVVPSTGESNLFYINQGNGTFTKKANEMVSGFNEEFNLGAAFADYDNDGHLDLIVGALNFPFPESLILGDKPLMRLFKNSVTTGNWLKIKLNGAAGPNSALSNRTAIGARLKIVAGGKTQIREISSLTGTGSQNSLIAHFGIGTETTITSLEVKFPSGTTKTLTDVAANQLLVIDEDGEGPQVAAFVPKNRDKGFESEEISVNANDAVSVAGVSIVYRPIGGETFVTNPMDRVGITNEWKTTIQEGWYDDMGLEFYFEAIDPFGNATRSPEADNHYSYFNYRETNAPKFPTSSLVFGGTEATWNIVSIPFDLGTSATVTSVLDELGAFDNTLWRLLTYQNQTEWAEFPSTFSSFNRGQGYFLNVKTPPSAGITIADEILAPQNNQSNLFSMDLNQGWNQIGNPYLVNVNWADVKAFNAGVTGVGDLKVYSSNGRTYGDGTTLEVYGGGFVFANEAVSDYKISFPGQSAGGRKREAAKIASTALDADNWRARFTLVQSDVTFTLGGIGMNPEAKVSYDDFDDVTTPRLNDFLEMNFHHPEHFAKRFSRDIVPTQDEYTWEFTVDSNLEGLATLNWDNSGFGANENELYLFDIAQQKPIDMREASDYTFNANTSSRFKVYFGENLAAKIQPEKIQLGKAYPNPTSGRTTIPFTLPEATGSYHVRLEVYDMVGRRVDVLKNEILPAGFYESEWDSTHKQFSNGLYTYRLVVAGERKNEVYTDKIILNK